MTGDPFRALGLPASPDLSDDQVRAAWRRIATATHPDRADGGDPQAYRDASAAYAALRTGWGRSEARADMRAALSPAPPPAVPARSRLIRQSHLAKPPVPTGRAVLLPARVWRGRRGRLALRILVPLDDWTHKCTALADGFSFQQARVDRTRLVLQFGQVGQPPVAAQVLRVVDDGLDPQRDAVLQVYL